MDETNNTKHENRMPASPSDRMIETGAVYAAAGGQRTLRVFPTDHQLYRTWVVAAGEGSVTYWDAGNGWCQIQHVDMDQEAELRFWGRLTELVSENPSITRPIQPDPVTEILADNGFYNADLLLDI